jgi:hypothetical protein
MDAASQAAALPDMPTSRDIKTTAEPAANIATVIELGMAGIRMCPIQWVSPSLRTGRSDGTEEFRENVVRRSALQERIGREPDAMAQRR